MSLNLDSFITMLGKLLNEAESYDFIIWEEKYISCLPHRAIVKIKWDNMCVEALSKTWAF